MLYRKNLSNVSIAAIALACLVLTSGANAALVTTNLITHLDSDLGVTLSGSDVTGWAGQATGDEALSNLQGFPVLTPANLNGHATINFDGADRMQGLSTSKYTLGTGDFTFYAVVNVSGSSSGDRNVFVTTEPASPFNGIIFRTGNEVSSRLQTRAGNAGNPISTAPGELVDGRGAWHIYTGRRIGSTFDLWKDGVLQESKTNSSLISSTNPLGLGGLTYATNQNGIFDIANLTFYDAGLAGDATTGLFAEQGAFLEERYGLTTDFNFAAAIPEPSTFALGLLALTGLGFVRRRRSRPQTR